MFAYVGWVYSLSARCLAFACPSEARTCLLLFRHLVYEVRFRTPLLITCYGTAHPFISLMCHAIHRSPDQTQLLLQQVMHTQMVQAQAQMRQVGCL